MHWENKTVDKSTLVPYMFEFGDDIKIKEHFMQMKEVFIYRTSQFLSISIWL